MGYERLAHIIERQRRNKLLDVAAAGLLAFTLGLTGLAIHSGMPQVAAAPVVEVAPDIDPRSPTSYTAFLLPDFGLEP